MVDTAVRPVIKAVTMIVFKVWKANLPSNCSTPKRLDRFSESGIFLSEGINVVVTKATPYFDPEHDPQNMKGASEAEINEIGPDIE